MRDTRSVVLLTLLCTTSCRGVTLSNDLTDLGAAEASPAPKGAPRAAAVLQRTNREVERAEQDLATKMAAAQGGEQAKQVVQNGFDVVKQINAIAEKTAAAAKRARESEALAETAAGVMAKPGTNAVTVSQKLSRALEARDQAQGILRRAQANKLEAKKLSAKAAKKVEQMDALNIRHANDMVRVHDEGQYALDKAIRLREAVARKMKKDKGGVKMEKAKEKAVEADAAAEATNSKVQHEKDTEKLKLTKAKDADKLAKAKATITADEAKLKSKSESIEQEEALAASSMSKAEQLKLKLQKEQEKFKLRFAQSKVKAKASHSLLKRAKKEEKASFEKLKAMTTASDKATADSIQMKVVVQKGRGLLRAVFYIVLGAPIDPSALTAARKAAHLLNDLDIAKRQNDVQHQSVIEATKAYTKAKIAHRVLELRHESASAAAAQAKQRAQKKNTKKANKMVEKAKEKGEKRSERMMLRARAKARKKMAEETKKAEAFKAAELKKVAASKVKKSPQIQPTPKKVDPDEQAANEAIGKEMSKMIKAESEANAKGDEPVVEALVS